VRRNSSRARNLPAGAFTEGPAPSGFSRLIGFLARNYSTGVRFALRGLLFSALGLCGLSGLSASAQAQSITSVSVNPTTFTGAGQTLTFSIGFSTGTQLNSLTITANSADSPDDTISCPASFPITNVPASFTCTATHVTTAFDVSAGFALETPSFVAVTLNNQTDSGTGNQARATYVAPPPTQTATTTAVTSSLNPSVFGQSVTFTATVTGASGPTGSVTFSDGATTLGSATLSGGQATFTTTALAVGGHSVTAAYGGDANNLSSSGSLTQTVNQESTVATLTSGPNPSVFGQSVTFTATVSAAAPGTGTPTGSVTFKDGGTTIGSGTLSGGQATFTTTALAVGGHSITAVYGGDTNSAGSTSSTLTQTVNQESTVTVLTSNISPTVFGQSVTFTATVSAAAPGTGTPTGSVTFKDGGATIGSATLSGGVATFTTTTLAVGGHSITAVYGGATNSAGSTSSTLTQTVNQESTVTVLTSNINPTVFGQSVTFTATVSAAAPGTGTPSGSVTFKDGGTTIGAGTVSGGVATFTTTTLAVGGHSITAVYGGDSNNLGSTSPALTQSVNQESTVTGLTSSINPAVPGQSVTFTATVSAVSPGTGTPSGSVSFKDGATTLGSVTLSGGQATFTTTTLAVGPHSITAVYAGDTNNAGSTSSALTETVNKASTSVSLTSSANPAVPGQSVAFTATVSAAPPATGTPTGSVTFMDGATTLGSVTLSAGKATFTTTALAVGPHSITAVYGGDANDTGATSPALTETVNKASTSVSLTSSANPAVPGQSVTFTATVSAAPPATGTPGGSVTFMDGATTLGAGTLSAGKATFTTTALAVGGHSITAVYGGDANDAGSTSPALTQSVNKASTSASLTSSVNPVVIGRSVTFTATVSAAPPATGTPTGSVTFKDGATTLGAGTLSGGVATFTTTALAVGGHSITAVYGGDANNSSSTSPALTETVNKATLTIAVKSSSTAPSFGTSITLTATVTGGFSPTGTVKFLDGSTPLANVTLSGGRATFSTAALSVGAHSITVAYSGDGNNQPATSSALTVTVSKASTTTVLAASATSSLFNSPITFTATVSGKAPTGTVTFRSGSTTLGTVALSAGHASLTVSTLSVGNHSIVATYNGDGDNLTSSSSPLSVAITRPNPATDPDVQGLVTAQVTAEVNFAQTQTDNVIQRLEALHDDSTPFFTNNLGFGALQPPDQPPNGPPAYADTQDPLNRDPAFVAIDKASRNGAPQPSMGVPPFAIWTAGTVLQGSTNILGSPPAPDNHFTTSGVTAGVDAHLSADLRAGFAIGFGADHTAIGTDGTTSDGTNISGTAYASYRPFGSLFVDGLLGYGAATFKSDRFVALPGEFEPGSREGSEVYGALIVTSEQKWDNWRVAPYTRLQFIDATLNPFTEQGDPTWALSYASASMQEISGVVGLRGAYNFEMGWGILSPTLRVEYAHAFNNTLTQVLTYADTPDVNYSFAVAGLGENTVSGSIGLSARYKNGVTAQIEYQYSNAGSAEQSQGLRGTLKIPF
jgi:uncharacterized protein YhjY with autotransporter beta-barrel domain